MTTAVTINPFLTHQIVGIQVPVHNVNTSWHTHKCNATTNITSITA